jgi:UDP-GlcNAc:undecaprenyl-phosphate GlcNAc-1-phosphate transferase
MPPEAQPPFLQTGWISLLSNYWLVFVVAFVVSVITTPIMRWVARKTGIVDHPDTARKLHKKPTAYLGGVAVFLAVLSGIIVSYFWVSRIPVFQPFPFVVLLGMVAIGITGLADDIFKDWEPRLKVAGQLIAAAAIAQQGVGTRVAEGFMRGVLGIPEDVCNYPLIAAGEIGFYMPDPITLTYITGVIIIALFVLGACNAANLLDGLDGLLSGTVAITCIGLLVISTMITLHLTEETLVSIMEHLPLSEFLNNRGNGITLMGANLVLGFSVLGAVFGFLIYNFNPASIFLGDAGSLLLGYLCIVMVLMLGEQGQTFIVVAGLIVFALPILDTLLAIIRRKVAGKPMSEPDSNHIHHIIMRRLVNVKLTVLALYGISSLFCLLGVALAWAHITGAVGGWAIYLAAIIIFGGICSISFRAAHKHHKSCAK